MAEKISQKKKWVSTDAWRGYYTYENSVAGGWIPTMEDESVKGKGKEEQEDIKKIRSALKKNKIPSLVKYNQTSNVFSVGWDIIVPKTQVAKSKRIVKSLRDVV